MWQTLFTIPFVLTGTERCSCMEYLGHFSKDVQFLRRQGKEMKSYMPMEVLEQNYDLKVLGMDHDIFRHESLDNPCMLRNFSISTRDPLFVSFLWHDSGITP